MCTALGDAVVRRGRVPSFGARRTCRATGRTNRNGCATVGVAQSPGHRKLFCRREFRRALEESVRPCERPVAHNRPASFVTAEPNFVTLSKSTRIKMIARRRVSACYFTNYRAVVSRS